MLRKRKMINAIALLLSGALLLGGCGADPAGSQPSGGAQEGKKEEGGSGTTMGRFMDERVELPGEVGGVFYLGLAQSENEIRISNGLGGTMISRDKGQSFQYDEEMPQAYFDLAEDEEYLLYSSLVMPNGAYFLTMYSRYGDFAGSRKCVLVTADNQVIDVTGLDADSHYQFYTGEDGRIYAAETGGDMAVCQIDADTGEVTFLWNAPAGIGYMAACGGKLFAATKESIQIFDLDKMELAENDEVLSDFLKTELEKITYSGTYNFLIFQGTEEDSIYVVTEKGLYKHVLYGSMMEQVIDGSLCSIGDASKSYSSMRAVKGAKKDSFLLLFSDGTLMRYVYDPSIPTVPEKTLRLYSIYEDYNIKRAVSAFQQSHQDLYVKYEIGVTGDNGVTPEDALKNLSTELVAGKGPDILLMDDIPYQSYVEKGVLADLSGLLAEMQGEEFFGNVIENFRKEDKLYTIPIVFSMALLAGPKEELEGIGTLSDLAQLLEEKRDAQPQGSIMSFVDAKSLLALLSQASSGTWVKEDGSLDKEAVTEYLAQCKRIYDAQMSGIGDSVKEAYTDTRFGVSGSNSRGMSLYGVSDATAAASIAYYLKQPYSAGFFSGAPDELSFYTSMLDAMDHAFVPLPGQLQQSCIPATLISVNQASGVTEEAKEFVRFILSSDFQSTAYLSGAPINKAAYMVKQQPEEGQDSDTPYGMVGMMNEDGMENTIDIYWPDEEVYSRFNEIVEKITKVCRCDERVYQAVIELGEAAMTGETGIEEAVNAIEKKVQLYLAE